MKIKYFSLLGCLFLTSCATVQVAQLDKTRPVTSKIDLYRETPILERKYSEVAYLSVANVNEKNYTASLGKLMNMARKVGADALILQESACCGAGHGSKTQVAQDDAALNPDEQACCADATNALTGLAIAYGE